MNDRYEILQLIVKDEVGGVYLAEDSTLERKVSFRNFEAVKGEEILTKANDEFSEFSGKLTALQHPNLITIFDIAFDDGEAYMVTQYVEDESLAERLEKGPLLQDRVYKMASDILEALHAAHESGIYHGALNTQSIRRIPRASGGYRCMVVDMGLNHLATIIRGPAGGIVDPILLAPEFQDSNEQSARGDLFMLGQLCYTALAGGHPFAGETKEKCAELYLADALPPIEDYVSGVQENFMHWIRHLAKGDPEQRPIDTKEAMQLLNDIKLPDPEPPIPVAALAAPPVATAVATTPTAPMASATPSQQVAQTVPMESYPQQSNPNKLPIIIISVLVVLIGAVALFLVFNKPGDDSDKADNTSGLPSVPDGVLIHMHSAEAVDAEPVDLDTESVLDWSVTTGVPVSGSRQRMKGGKYISNVIQSGKFKEISGKAAHFSIKYKAGDKDIVSNGITNPKQKAAVGKGWEVYLRVPQKHQGPLLVSYYVVHRNCSFSILATPARSGEKPITFNIDANDAGKSKVLLEIPDPKQGGFYTFKILTGSPVDGKGFTFGLSAIQVSGK